MNAKKLSFLLLILVAVACTNRSTSSEQDEVRHWNNVLQQINAFFVVTTEIPVNEYYHFAIQILQHIFQTFVWILKNMVTVSIFVMLS